MCARLDFQIAVHEPGQLAMLEAARLDRPLTVWLDLDTGMNRLGFRPEAAPAAYARLRDCAAVGEVRLMTHFASADEPTDPATRRQIERFAAAAGQLGLARSFCNSAGVLAWPEAHAEWIRPGVMLYGISPMPGRTGPDEGLLPVMTLTTALIAVREVAGRRDGRLWRHLARRGPVADRHRRHGLCRRLPAPRPLGHAGPGRRPALGHRRPRLDGHAGGRPVRPARTPGSATRSSSGAEGLPAERVAAGAGTIAYELLCHLARRVHVEIRDDPC